MERDEESPVLMGGKGELPIGMTEANALRRITRLPRSPAISELSIRRASVRGRAGMGESRGILRR